MATHDERRRITTPEGLAKLASEMGMRRDWHEPDEQGVDVEMLGQSFDNCGFWPECDNPRILEKHVVISKDGKAVATLNMAYVLAWASAWGREIKRKRAGHEE